jgi:hypothetical protein
MFCKQQASWIIWSLYRDITLSDQNRLSLRVDWLIVYNVANLAASHTRTGTGAGNDKRYWPDKIRTLYLKDCTHRATSMSCNTELHRRKIRGVPHIIYFPGNLCVVWFIKPHTKSWNSVVISFSCSIKSMTWYVIIIVRSYGVPKLQPSNKLSAFWTQTERFGMQLYSSCCSVILLRLHYKEEN